MVDISLFDPTTITNVLFIAISGALICIGVHFVPVGGAPAAMAQATGIGTGTVELAAGSGLVGLITSAYMQQFPFYHTLIFFGCFNLDFTLHKAYIMQNIHITQIFNLIF